jgi:hypothetical protein
VKDGFAPPIPIQVLAKAQGRLYSSDELARKFSRAVFPRTTNRYGCVTLHSYHFYVEQGVPTRKCSSGCMGSNYEPSWTTSS